MSDLQFASGNRGRAIINDLAQELAALICRASPESLRQTVSAQLMARGSDGQHRTPDHQGSPRLHGPTKGVSQCH